MTLQFLLPDLGEGLREAEIVEWHVAEGDTVRLNQPLAEVETAKAVVELPSPYAGVVRGLHARAGDVVAVGAPLVSVDAEGEEPAEEAPAEPTAAEPPEERTAPAQADAEAPGPNLVGYGAAAASDAPPRRRPRIWGSGPGPDRPLARGRADHRIPVRGVRKVTAEAMVRSAFTAPHASAFLDVDATATTDLLRSWRDDPVLRDARINLMAVVSRATVLALRRTPSLNASWDEDAGEIVEHGAVHLGVAAATERGLLVPVIRDADLLELPALAVALRQLAETARAGRTAPADLSGSTFSISNVGALGMDAGTPIINPGESGILAVGALRRRPWEHAGELALRDVLTLSLSFDHRIVDGAEAARFLGDVAGILREPGRALLG
ncbi:dihydrolipoamide acetyltransferase family protein [Microbacterium sp. GXF7504]